MDHATEPDLDSKIEAFDRAALREHVAAADRDRQRVLEEFPRRAWPELPLERYALGVDRSDGAGRPFRCRTSRRPGDG